MPYWRLSGFYFFYFAALGVLVPYWGLYLQAQGFGPVAIGELMAVLMATKIIAPNIWGWIADHTGRRMAIVRLASLLSVLIFVGVYFAAGFWTIALIMALFSFFWNASLPQFEAVTFSHLGSDVSSYSRIRLWGSLGFIVTVSALGWLIEWRDASVVPSAVLVLFSGIWLASLSVPERARQQSENDEGPIVTVIRRPEVLALLGACFLMQASHGAYYAFYSIFLKAAGYPSGLIGQLWALGVIAEVALFLVMHRLLGVFGARRVLIGSLFLAAVRWTLVANFVESLTIVAFAQILHAATFGAYHAAAIHLIHKYFIGRHQGRGQALYSSLSFGAGGAVGSLYSGFLWSGPGPGTTFGVSAGLSVLAVGIAWKWLDRSPGHQ